MGRESCGILDYFGLFLVGTDMHDNSMGIFIEMDGSILSHFAVGSAKQTLGLVVVSKYAYR